MEIIQFMWNIGTIILDATDTVSCDAYSWSWAPPITDYILAISYYFVE